MSTFLFSSLSGERRKVYRSNESPSDLRLRSMKKREYSNCTLGPISSGRRKLQHYIRGIVWNRARLGALPKAGDYFVDSFRAPQFDAAVIAGLPCQIYSRPVLPKRSRHFIESVPWHVVHIQRYNIHPSPHVLSWIYYFFFLASCHRIIIMLHRLGLMSS